MLLWSCVTVCILGGRLSTRKREKAFEPETGSSKMALWALSRRHLLILDQPLCQATRIFTSLPKSIRVKRSHHHVCLKDSRSCHGPVSCFISSLHSKSRRFILACRRRRHNVGLLNFFLGTTELGRFSSFPFFLSRTYYSKFDRTGFL